MLKKSRKLLLIVFPLILTACTGEAKKDENEFETIYSSYLSYCQAKGETPLSFEQYIKAKTGVDNNNNLVTRRNNGQFEWKLKSGDQNSWKVLINISSFCTHQITDGVVSRSPNCSNTGSQYQYCSLCYHTTTKQLDKNNEHHYVDGECEYCHTKEIKPGTLILKVDSLVYPYTDDVKNYLESNYGYVKKYNYLSYQFNNSAKKFVYKPITIKWECLNPLSDFTLTYSTNQDYSNGKTITVDKGLRSTSLYNLYKSTKYYVKLAAEYETGTTIQEATFDVTDFGPRVCCVDGIQNVRDIGGFVTPFGTVKQGMIIRGGSLTPGSGDVESAVGITEKGKITLRDDFKIKTEMELRNENSSTVLYDADFVKFPIGSYESAIESIQSKSSTWKNLFKALAVKESYPFYIHCTAGADRTGTTSFLIESLLGASQTDLLHDYEMTSFSWYGIRDRDYGGSSGDKDKHATYNYMIEALKTNFTGNSLMEKVEKALLNLGITQSEINSIRAINLGITDEEAATLYHKTRITSSLNENYALGSVNDPIKISASKSKGKTTTISVSSDFTFEIGSLVRGRYEKNDNSNIEVTQSGKNITFNCKDFGNYCVKASSPAGDIYFWIICE